MDVKDNHNLHLKQLFCSISSYTHCEIYCMSKMSCCSWTASKQLFHLYHDGNKLTYILNSWWRLPLLRHDQMMNVIIVSSRSDDEYYHCNAAIRWWILSLYRHDQMMNIIIVTPRSDDEYYLCNTTIRWWILSL